MPAGFQAFNSSSAYQIDGENQNLSLVRKGSVSASFSSYYNRCVADIAVAPDEVLAIACTSHCAQVFRNASKVTVATELTSGSVGIDYWVFGESGFTASGIGLQVFGPGAGALADRVIYDSAFPPFNVVQSLTGGDVAGVNVTLPSGRVYAVVPQRVRSVFNRAKTDIDFGVVNLLSDALRVSGNVVYVQRKQVLAYDGMLTASEGTWSNGITSSHLIIDVTNL